jgi:hypothetical protein
MSRAAVASRAGYDIVVRSHIDTILYYYVKVYSFNGYHQCPAAEME